MDKTLQAFAIAAALLACRGAGAQTDLPLFQPAPPAPTRAPSRLKGTVLEPVVRVGQALLEAGVLPRIRYVQSFAANPTGGLTQGTDTSGVVIFGADLNMAKLAGLTDSQFHATFAQFYGMSSPRTTSGRGRRYSRSTIRRNNSN